MLLDAEGPSLWPSPCVSAALGWGRSSGLSPAPLPLAAARVVPASPAPHGAQLPVEGSGPGAGRFAGQRGCKGDGNRAPSNRRPIPVFHAWGSPNWAPASRAPLPPSSQPPFGRGWRLRIYF